VRFPRATRPWKTSHATCAAPEAAPAGDAGLPHAPERVGEPNPVAEEAARSVLVRAYPCTGTMPVAPNHRQDADATITPDGVITSRRPDPSRVPNLTEEAPSVKCEASGEESPGAGFPASNFKLAPSNSAPAEGLSCETNPIGADAQEGQVLDEKGVTSDAVKNGRRKTKPMCDRISLERRTFMDSS